MRWEKSVSRLAANCHQNEVIFARLWRHHCWGGHMQSHAESAMPLQSRGSIEPLGRFARCPQVQLCHRLT